MVYDQLAKELDAGKIFVNDSFSFKSLKQDLTPDWPNNKKEVLEKLNNPVLNTPIQEQLESFQAELEPLQEKQGNTQGLEFIKRLSPIAWRHIILDGYYQFRNIAGIIDLEQMLANLVFEDAKKSKT